MSERPVITINGQTYQVLKQLANIPSHRSYKVENDGEYYFLKVYRQELAIEFDLQATQIKLLNNLLSNIIIPIEIGDSNGERFLLRSWIAEESFDSFSKKIKFNKKLLNEGLEIGVEICRSIQLLHQSKAIHGHITNNNCFFRPDQSPVITDPIFIPATSKNLHLLAEMGKTQSDLAPEQTKPDGVVDARTDVWQLGLLLCRLYTKKTDLVVNQRILMELYKAKLPLELIKVLWHSISEEPSERFPDAGTFATALSEVTLADYQKTVYVRPAPLAQGIKEKVNPKIKYAFIASILIGGLAVGEMYWKSRTTINPSEKSSLIEEREGNNTTNSTDILSGPQSPLGGIIENDNKPPQSWEELKQKRIFWTNFLNQHASDLTQEEFHTAFYRKRYWEDRKYLDVEKGNKKYRLVYLPGDVLLPLVWIPPGSFVMGTPESEKFHQKHEGLLTHVTISKGFWMGVTEVTQEQWLALSSVNKSQFQSLDHPVETVSWGRVMEYVDRFSKYTNLDVCLPTEAEWEYACRAGSQTTYHFGNDDKLLDNYAWYVNNSGGKTHPVAQKLPNPFGLYDMHGNVMEWCSTLWTHMHSGLDQVDPIGSPRYRRGKATPGGVGKDPVVKGGNAKNNIDWIRSGMRHRADPYWGGSTGIGFRVIIKETRDKENVNNQVIIDQEGVQIKEVNGREIAIFQLFPDTNYELVKVEKNDGTEFWISKTETTVSQFHQFVQETGYYTTAEKTSHCWTWHEGQWWKKTSGITYLNPGFPQDKNAPVSCVSPEDAIAYCQWLSDRTGLDIHLPAEENWSYAAAYKNELNGPGNDPFYWNDDAGYIFEYINGADHSLYALHPKIGDTFFQDGYPYSSPVGRFKPNDLGLFDVIGNISEITGTKTKKGTFIKRDGSWRHNDSGLNLKISGEVYPTGTFNWIGFRIAASNVTERSSKEFVQPNRKQQKAQIMEWNFDNKDTMNWSSKSLEKAPYHSGFFLGRFLNQTTTLTVNNAPPHTSVKIQFDVLTLGSWDGNSEGTGPDRVLASWVDENGAQSILNTTFAYGRNQSFPGSYPDGKYNAKDGAWQVNGLGYTWDGKPTLDSKEVNDATYRVIRIVESDSEQFRIMFKGDQRGLPDEWWGLDNVILEFR